MCVSTIYWYGTHKSHILHECFRRNRLYKSRTCVLRARVCARVAPMKIKGSRENNLADGWKNGQFSCASRGSKRDIAVTAALTATARLKHILHKFSWVEVYNTKLTIELSKKNPPLFSPTTWAFGAVFFLIRICSFLHYTHRELKKFT